MRTTNPSPHAALASCRQEGVHGAASPCRVPPHPTKPTRSRQPPPVRRVSAVRGSWGGSLLGSGGLERGAAHIFLKTKPWSSDPPWACGDPGCCPSSCRFPLFPPPHLSWEPSRNGVLAGCPAPPPDLFSLLRETQRACPGTTKIASPPCVHRHGDGGWDTRTAGSSEGLSTALALLGSTGSQRC